MVNDDILSRINQFINVYNLSNSEFANVINISRSNISHVLSGRNKPSLDFILKIKKAYGNLSLDWLLEGNGTMLIEEEMVKIKPIDPPKVEKASLEKKKEIKPKPLKETEIKVENLSILKDVSINKERGKEVEKIIIFYTDNTFDIYNK